MDLESYKKINSSYSHRFVYRLGGSTGFFSEYNNMVLAIHYCLVNRIQFVLQSEDANFSSGKGWTEFFLPFCTEIKGKWLRRYNHRIKPVYKNRKEWFCFNVYKRFHPRLTYMYELFNMVRSVNDERRYDIDELNLHGSLLENCSEIHRMIWRYNGYTQKRIDELINTCDLPERYVGMHIRQGDKFEESEVLLPSVYIEKAIENSSIDDFFVLTDDYRVMIELKSMYPDKHYITLCQESEEGYSYPKLCSMSEEERKNSYLRLWASMDILEKSVLFVGTYSANPGMNMGFRMEQSKIKCVDFDEWQLW